jgi:hypothetical protein
MVWRMLGEEEEVGTTTVDHGVAGEGGSGDNGAILMCGRGMAHMRRRISLGPQCMEQG